MEKTQFSLCFIGFGEVAQHYALGLHGEGLANLCALDPRFDGDHQARLRDRAAELGVEICLSLEEAAARCPVLIGLAPGSASFAIAEELVPFLSERHLYADLASAGAEVKRQVARVVAESGALFVDGAVMSHATTDLHATVVIASGDGAETLRTYLVPWGARIEVIDGAAGTAATFKNLRSVLSKGLEAIIFECVEAAGHLGIAREVVMSLSELIDARPSFIDTVDYHLTSGVLHARRRSEELSMAAETIRSVGVEPRMTLAAAQTLARLADRCLDKQLDGETPSSEDVYRMLRNTSGPPALWRTVNDFPGEV